jgi:anaerobic sulfite reductase subunit B
MRAQPEGRPGDDGNEKADPTERMKTAILKSMFQPKKAVVERVIRETPDIRSILLRPEGGFRFQPGQFAMITAAEAGEAPFAPSSSADEQETLRITVQKTGAVTSGIHGLKPGDTVGIRGPYGKPFSLDPFSRLDLAFTVRGIGLATARPFILNALGIRESFLKIALWTDPADALPHADDMSSWTGKIDVITGEEASGSDARTKSADSLRRSGIRPERAAVLLFCGWEENRSLAYALLQAGFLPERIFLWIETRMDCAIGQCRRCTLDHLFVCTEGPLISLQILSGLRNFGGRP